METHCLICGKTPIFIWTICCGFMQSASHKYVDLIMKDIGIYSVGYDIPKNIGYVIKHVNSMVQPYPRVAEKSVSNIEEYLKLVSDAELLA